MPGLLENNSRSAQNCLSDLSRLNNIEQPQSHLDHSIISITYKAAETGLSIKKQVMTYCLNRWPIDTKMCKSLVMLHDTFLKLWVYNGSLK